jgi:hypothetical protein
VKVFRVRCKTLAGDGTKPGEGDHFSKCFATGSIVLRCRSAAAESQTDQQGLTYCSPCGVSHFLLALLKAASVSCSRQPCGFGGSLWSLPIRRRRLSRQGRPTGNEGFLQNRAKNRHTQDDRKRRRYRCQTHVRRNRMKRHGSVSVNSTASLPYSGHTPERRL